MRVGLGGDQRIGPLVIGINGLESLVQTTGTESTTDEAEAETGSGPGPAMPETAKIEIAAKIERPLEEMSPARNVTGERKKRRMPRISPKKS